MANLFPAPKIIQVPVDDHQPSDDFLDRAVNFYLVHGESAPRCAASLGVEIEKVEKLFASDDFLVKLKDVKEKPQLALPSRAKLFAMLNRVAETAIKDADKLKAIKMMIELQPAKRAANLNSLAHERASA